MNQTEDKKQRNKARTFIQLVESNKQSMYKIARSYLSNDEDIADAIQDAIESCWRNLDQLEKPAYFRTWMTRILIHKCIDIIRKNRREHPVSDFPEYGAEHKDLDNYEFSELMKSLDEKYRTILLLYYGEGFKISEIAQLLDMEENTVKTRLSRGRQKFRMMWDSQDAVRQS
ncbi:MAG TPA: RNA polymerase sigma factor [Candidatus Mediterraneibacter guildfordensis]|jgi:RNA polymerase sigma-70 factor (ECF subfamily)|nr:RNA polymerase sigma factor [Candidatus Mediterraneibacter guildfordensis]